MREQLEPRSYDGSFVLFGRKKKENSSGSYTEVIFFQLNRNIPRAHAEHVDKYLTNE